MSFATVYKALVPSWLSKGDGGKVLSSLGQMLDEFASRTRDALEARMPSRAPDDALALLGQDRVIVRGIDEASSTFATRLLRWLDDHHTRGNAFALIAQLRAYLGTNAKIRTVDNRGNWYTVDQNGVQSYLLAQGNWDWDGDATSWSRFWVIIYASTSPWTLGRPPYSGHYNDGALWGDGRTWGSSATLEQIASLKEIVRRWRPAGTRCVSIILAFDDTSFDPTSVVGLPDGTWGTWSKIVNGVRVPARLTTASYFDGDA